MGAKPAGDAVLTAYAKSIIQFKARQLSRLPGFSRSDAVDLEQELWRHVTERARQFDPARASLNTFIAQIVTSKVATILRDRGRQKRAPGFFARSLDAPVPGASVALRDTLCDGGTRPEEPIDTEDRNAAVRRIVDALPPELREIARRLMNGTESSVARDLNISRRQVRHAVELLRDRFSAAGFGDS